MAMQDDERASGSWGHCMHCRFYGQHGASDQATDTGERRCSQPELERFDLVVTESAGCNHFAKAEGLSPDVEEPAAPPRLPAEEQVHTLH